MKFSNGRWKLREGVRAQYPGSVHEVQTTPQRLRLLASDRHGSSRGILLGAAVFTIDFSSPIENVIRVRLARRAGDGAYPCGFELSDGAGGAAGSAEMSANTARLTSGDLRVDINSDPNGPWQIRYSYADRLLTGSADRGTASVRTPDGEFIQEALALSVGETIYGLGERFTPTIRNGQVVESWNEDPGTCSELAYKSVPFYLSSRGYGVLVNHAGRLSFEVGSEYTNAVQFSAPGQVIEYFIIGGQNPKDVLDNYTRLSGRPTLPPAWSFGLWLTTSFLTSYDEQTVNGHIQGMAQRDIPLHVFHFDCFWMREGRWCDFQWDPKTFPDPPAMLARMKQRGLRICVWINPYIAQESALYAEGVSRGYLLRRTDGSVYQWDEWQPGAGIVDFTHPAARRWFQDCLRVLIRQGVDCFKTDFGERIPTDVRYHDGSDAQAMHNRYSILYNQTVHEVLAAEKGPDQTVLFARASTAGGQRFPIHWGGDSNATFESMAETLRGGLSLGLCGFGFWSHDISGFENTATPALYKRWVAFGLLSSHSRLHGSNTLRVPWAFDEEACRVLRHFVGLKCLLMPYLWGHAVEATRTGVPLLRHMILEFPDDPACRTFDRQYMLGDRLLVAPVFDPDGWCEYYLPAGAWIDLLRGHTVQGGRWFREQFDAFGLPLFVRENTVLPLGGTADRPDYDFLTGLTLIPFGLTPGSSVRIAVPTLDGKNEAVFTVRARADGTCDIACTGAAARYSIKSLAAADVAARLRGP